MLEIILMSIVLFLFMITIFLGILAYRCKIFSDFRSKLIDLDLEIYDKLPSDRILLLKFWLPLNINYWKKRIKKEELNKYKQKLKKKKRALLK